ncbi:MAG: chemotaxis protein CheC [Planctomycetota bacterium]
MELTVDQVDAIREVLNMGAGRAAGILNSMIGHPIQLSIPRVDVLHSPAVPPTNEEPTSEIALVRLNFSGRFRGHSSLLFPNQSAANLVTLLTEEDASSPDFFAARASTLTEVGNIVINGVLGTLANLMSQPFEVGLPIYQEGDYQQLTTPDGRAGLVLVAQTDFLVEQLELRGSLRLSFEVASFEAILQALQDMTE